MSCKARWNWNMLPSVNGPESDSIWIPSWLPGRCVKVKASSDICRRVYRNTRVSFYDNPVKRIGPDQGLHLCEGGCFVSRDSCVFRDAHHGEDLFEVRRQAKDADGAMAGRALLDQHLDDDRNARRIDVIDPAKVE